MKQPPIYIVMNRHVITANRKLAPEQRQPAVRVTRGKHGKPVYCDSFQIHGPCELLNGIGEGVMPCGATIAIKTEAAMTLFTRGQHDVHLAASEALDLAA
ncbi:hypothetical protein [Methylorubrum populi]|uniref:hypothetical protein n=1 Tax=Methylorubrum populi TaxID=223967 RepID=UPI000DB8E465|nr:hypothetical protein [Methylorubrum populi]PZP71736.1 MAG: hypothetical protein DI590_05595 [Methylorubrum populi]